MSATYNDVKANQERQSDTFPGLPVAVHQHLIRTYRREIHGQQISQSPEGYNAQFSRAM
jgi:hypothetical protein